MSVTAAIIAASALSAGANALSSNSANKTSVQEAQKNRDFQEKMYRLYQSPAAMMRQYKEANLNPYLAGADGLGQGASFSPSSQPDIKTPDLSGLNSLGSSFVQQQANSIMSADQRSKQFSDIFQRVSESLNSYGPEGASQLLNSFRPQLKALGYSNVAVDNVFSPMFEFANAQASVEKIKASWQNTLSATEIANLDQQISESVGRLGLMSSQSDLNRQEIRESWTRIGRHIAEAFKLQKEGEYYHASAATANKIRDYIVDQYILSNGSLGLGLLSSDIDYGIKSAGADINRKIAGDPTLQGVKFALETLGNVIHVGGNFSWSNVNSRSHSNVNSNSNSVVNSRSISDVYMHRVNDY